MNAENLIATIDERYRKELNLRYEETEFRESQRVLHEAILGKRTDNETIKPFLQEEIRQAVRDVLQEACDNIFNKIFRREVSIDEFEFILTKYNILENIAKTPKESK